MGFHRPSWRERITVQRHDVDSWRGKSKLFSHLQWKNPCKWVATVSVANFLFVCGEVGDSPAHVTKEALAGLGPSCCHSNRLPLTSNHSCCASRYNPFDVAYKHFTGSLLYRIVDISHRRRPDVAATKILWLASTSPKSLHALALIVIIKTLRLFQKKVLWSTSNCSLHSIAAPKTIFTSLYGYGYILLGDHSLQIYFRTNSNQDRDSWLVKRCCIIFFSFYHWTILWGFFVR